MRQWKGLGEVPPGFGPSAVTIGNFDGVHRGHQGVLRQLASEASKVGLSSVAVTFDPHPLRALHPERAPALLTSIDDRLEYLSETGLDAVLVLEFDLELAQHSPRAFVEKYFVDALDAKMVFVGRDVRFGWRNSGNLETMIGLGADLGFTVRALDDIAPLASTNGRRWSSTWIRELLAEGDVAQAAQVLGRLHRVSGTVVHGDARGRELGFPTANLNESPNGVVPADGVYAGWLRRPVLESAGVDDRLPAAISIGTNPTFEGAHRRVEGYVLDRTDLYLYGEEIAYEFVERLRPTLTFDGVDALVEQMHLDVTRCRDVLGVAQPES